MAASEDLGPADRAERSGAVDVLSVGDGLPERSHPVRRTAVVLLVLALVAGWWVDHRIRADETEAVGGCAAGAAAAVRGAEGRITAMGGYVRPTLFAAPPGELKRELYRMVSGATVGARPVLVRALDRCRGVGVLPFHDALQQRRSRCLRWLREHLVYVDAVAADGRLAFSGTPRQRSGVGCSAEADGSG